MDEQQQIIHIEGHKDIESICTTVLLARTYGNCVVSSSR